MTKPKAGAKRGRPGRKPENVAAALMFDLSKARGGATPKARNSHLSPLMKHKAKTVKNVLSPLRSRATAQLKQIGTPEEAAQRIAAGTVLDPAPIFDVETMDPAKILKELERLFAQEQAERLRTEGAKKEEARQGKEAARKEAERLRKARAREEIEQLRREREPE